MHRAQVEAAETSGVPLAWRWGTLWKLVSQGRSAIRRLGVFVLAAAGLGAAALAHEVHINKAVDCMTLSQQFGDSVKTAKVEDGVKKGRPICSRREKRPAWRTTTTPAWTRCARPCSRSD